MGNREIARLLVLSAFVALCAVVLFPTDAEAAGKIMWFHFVSKVIRPQTETGIMVWVKEETEDDESPKEKLGAITDSAKQRDFNDSEEKKGPGD
uniref:Secreted protein n=1 Tax=Magallana gigas TaxID=29159 RepID=K1RG97_MAGGI